MSKQVLFIHGWTNKRWEGHWQRIAAAKLRKAGHQVYYPQLPSTDVPVYAEWSEVILGEIALASEANAGEELVVVAHSLGSVTWLQLVRDGLVDRNIRVLLVAPADPELVVDLDGYSLDLKTVGSLPNAVVVGSNHDEWSPRGLNETFGELAVPLVSIEGAGHLSLKDGFGEWAGVVDWILNPAGDLSVR